MFYLEIKKNGEGNFTILESNKYKESIHLSLVFRMANNEQLIDYLSEKYTKSTYEIE